MKRSRCMATECFDNNEMNVEDVASRTGKLIVSLDFELGWGVIEDGQWRPRERDGVYTSLRSVLRRFLNELDAMEVPMTWATVGSMVAPRRDGEFSHLPQTIQRSIEGFLAEADPTTSDGRDLFEMVLGASAGHQIASHSYSHTRFTWPGYSVQAKTADVELSKEAFSPYGIEPDIFVFPINHSTNFEPLASAGFRVARVNPVESRFSANRWLNKLYYRTVAAPPPVAERRNEQGVIEHSGSMLFMWPGGSLSAARRRFVNHRAYVGLDRAVASGDTHHIWLHPFDLSQTTGLMDDLLAFLAKAASFRDRGQLHVGVM